MDKFIKFIDEIKSNEKKYDINGFWYNCNDLCLTIFFFKEGMKFIFDASRKSKVKKWNINIRVLKLIQKMGNETFELLYDYSEPNNSIFYCKIAAMITIKEIIYGKFGEK